MLNRAQDQGGARRPTAGRMAYMYAWYVKDWPSCPNADIETEGTF